MKPHKHAALMAEYAKDAQETERPWERWEYKNNIQWIQLRQNPVWDNDAEYRRKPRTININGIEVPEPLRVAPALHTRVYSPMPNADVIVLSQPWGQWESHDRLLSRGLIHLTYQAAELHARALLSFTETKP